MLSGKRKVVLSPLFSYNLDTTNHVKFKLIIYKKVIQCRTLLNHRETLVRGR